MSAAVATLHQPWCTEHVTDCGDWCHTSTDVGGLTVEIGDGLDDMPQIFVWASNGETSTPEEVRAFAAALIKTADAYEAAQR